MKVVKKTEIPYGVYGPWEVWPDGSIVGLYRNPVGRESKITIYPEQISQPDLLLTLHADGTVTDWNYFMDAFFIACRLAKVKQISNFQTQFD